MTAHSEKPIDVNANLGNTKKVEEKTGSKKSAKKKDSPVTVTTTDAQSVEENGTEEEGQHVSETSSKKKVPTVSVSAFSPIDFPAAELVQASEGCKKDVEENEHFDPIFYKNLIAMRQHDATKRPLTPQQAEQMFEQEEVEHKLIAKKVCPKKDIRCYINVHQQVYLGSGAFSDVYKGTIKVKPKSQKEKVLTVAIKKIWPDPSREDRQIAVHRKLDHPNLVKLLYYYVCVHPQSKDTMWSLIMELIPSTIALEQAKYIDKGKIMPQIYIKLFIYQTFCGLMYLEKNRFLHRDVKPENLLVDMATGKLKIGDFGSAKRYRPGDPNSSYQVTRYYRAPELCLKFTKYDTTVDVWAGGCILAEMLTNRIMFYGSDNADQLKKIFRICGTPTIEQLRECVPGHQIDPKVLAESYPPADWYRILRRYNRSVNKICSNFLSGILRYECRQRLRGLDALNHSYFASLHKKDGKLPNGAPFPPLEHLH